MEINTLNYKDATKELYGGVLPTARHVNMLINDKVLNAISIKSKGGGGGGNVTIQIAEDDLSHQYTHAILIVTENNLITNDEVAASLVDAGGESITHACETCIEKHGPLNVGQVLPLLPSGKLRCYHLLTTVFPKSQNILSEDQSVRFVLLCSQFILKLQMLNVNFYPYLLLNTAQRLSKKMITHMTDSGNK